MRRIVRNGIMLGLVLADPRLRANWVRTVPREGWFTYFRLYAPTEPYFDRSWQLPDIEKLN